MQTESTHGQLSSQWCSVICWRGSGGDEGSLPDEEMIVAVGSQFHTEINA